MSKIGICIEFSQTSPENAFLSEFYFKTGFYPIVVGVLAEIDIT